MKIEHFYVTLNRKSTYYEVALVNENEKNDKIFQSINNKLLPYAAKNWESIKNGEKTKI